MNTTTVGGCDPMLVKLETAAHGRGSMFQKLTFKQIIKFVIGDDVI